MATPSCPLMTMDSIREVCFYNRWSPVDRMFGSINIGDEVIWLVKDTPSGWNSTREHVHNKQCGRMANFLKAFHPLLAVQGEIPNPMCWPSDRQLTDASFPFVLFVRYCDAIYLICANMGSRPREYTKFVIFVTLHVIYGIPPTWKQHGRLCRRLKGGGGA